MSIRSCMILFWLCFLISVNGSDNLYAQQNYYLEIFSGAAENLRCPLIIKQKDQPAISTKAEYSTRPFDKPYYYIVKFGFSTFKTDWQIQFIHHKLYLENLPADVQHFEITHGYNMLTLNKIFELRKFYFLIGAGIILPHAQSEVRHKKLLSSGGILGSGYYITGPVVLLGIGKNYQLIKRLYLSIEGQIACSVAQVPIAEGEAEVTNLSMHGLLGFGYEF